MPCSPAIEDAGLPHARDAKLSIQLPLAFARGGGGGSKTTMLCFFRGNFGTVGEIKHATAFNFTTPDRCRTFPSFDGCLSAKNPPKSAEIRAYRRRGSGSKHNRAALVVTIGRGKRQLYTGFIKFNRNRSKCRKQHTQNEGRNTLHAQADVKTMNAHTVRMHLP